MITIISPDIVIDAVRISNSVELRLESNLVELY